MTTVDEPAWRITPEKVQAVVQRLSDINMPMDILVVSYSRFEALREKLGLVYREADRYGKVVYES